MEPEVERFKDGVMAEIDARTGTRRTTADRLQVGDWLLTEDSVERWQLRQITAVEPSGSEVRVAVEGEEWMFRPFLPVRVLTGPIRGLSDG